MSSNDRQTNSQHRPNSILDQPELPPARKGKPRLAKLRAAWKESWQEGGFLYQRWEDVFEARHASWHEIATWIKAAALLAGISLIVMLVDTAGDIASATLKGLSAAPATGTGDGNGLWGAVDHPVRLFLADQAAHLSVAPAALYAFWQLTGLLGLIGGFLGNAGARIAWLLFGIGSLAMIWSAAPAGGRAAATGLAALMWALASIFALRGLTLRPVVHNHPPQYQFNPALHPVQHHRHRAPKGNLMKLQETEFWVGTFHGRHDGLPAKVTATRDDTRDEPYVWTCTCGASQSFPTERGVFPTAWRHTHPICLGQLRQWADRLRQSIARLRRALTPDPTPCLVLGRPAAAEDRTGGTNPRSDRPRPRPHRPGAGPAGDRSAGKGRPPRSPSPFEIRRTPACSFVPTSSRPWSD